MLDIEKVISFAQTFMGRELSENELVFVLSERKAENSFIVPRQNNGREFITLVRLIALQSIVSKTKEQNISLEESMNNFIKVNQVPVPVIDIARVKGGYDKQEGNPLPKYGNRFETMVKLIGKQGNNHVQSVMRK